MKKCSLLVVFLFLISNVQAQEEHFERVFDSIIQEADLLYRYEKAVWNSTDRLMADKKLKKRLWRLCSSSFR